MTATPNVGPAKVLDEQMTRPECQAVLRRACFGHLAFAWERHADVRPIRFTYLDEWVYFRADPGLRKIIARSPWLVLSVTELDDSRHVASVIVRGGCYEAEHTGTTLGDAAALRGIMELRDRAPARGSTTERAPRVRRTSTVFRLHVDELRGVRAFVPCPAGERPHDTAEMQHPGDAGRDQTAAEAARADDDGMAAPASPHPARASRKSPRQ